MEAQGRTGAKASKEVVIGTTAAKAANMAEAAKITEAERMAKSAGAGANCVKQTAGETAGEGVAKQKRDGSGKSNRLGKSSHSTSCYSKVSWGLASCDQERCIKEKLLQQPSHVSS